MARSNPTRTSSGFLTFVMGLVLLALFAWLIVRYVHKAGPEADLETRRGQARKEKQEKLVEAHIAQLTTTGWVDKAKGVAHIPINDAMKLAMVELKGKKVTPSSVKVEPAPPVAVQEPNAEPQPPPFPSAPHGAIMIRFDTPEAGAPPAPATTPAPAAPVAPAPAAAPAP